MIFPAVQRPAEKAAQRSAQMSQSSGLYDLGVDLCAA
jgi:hypothetical protein